MSAAGAMGLTAAVLAVASWIVLGGWVIEGDRRFARAATVIFAASAVAAIAAAWMAVGA